MILTTKPSITQKEIDYVNDAITNGHGEHWGDYVKKFENSFAEYVGAKHAMATSSCTGAMHLSLVALGIGKGDEVIVPDMSWIATASVVRYVGATPVFVDVLADSWCINPEDIDFHMTSKTKAIIPVHLYGYPAAMDEIMDIAHEYGLKVVEDAAPAVGASLNGKKVGTFGDTGCFSFQGAKMISTGEGGMVVTDDTELFDKIKHFANQGRSGNGFEISDIGFKYKMSNLQAAWGLAQLERVDELIAKKRQIYQWYCGELSEVDGVELNKGFSFSRERYESIYWMSSIVLDRSDITRDGLRVKLLEKNIDTRPFFPPMSSFRMFKPTHNLTAKRLGANGINLPSGHDITHEQVVYICDCIKEILNEK